MKPAGRKNPLALGLALVALAQAIPALAGRSEDGVWRDAPEPNGPHASTPVGAPERYRALALDDAAMAALLARAPLEGSADAELRRVVLALPLPDGGFGRFAIEESPIMAPALARRFPQIRTYLGRGIDDPSASARIDRTPAGFHALVLATAGTVYVDPWIPGAAGLYVSYWKRDYRAEPPEDLVCHFGADAAPAGGATAPHRTPAAEGPEPAAPGDTLRVYRLAMAATGEYTQFHGGTKAAGMAAIVTAMNRVNGIYERELAIRMELVADNEDIVYTNPLTDPYSNFSGFVMLGENQANLDSVIGPANYDLGHVFSTGGGGIAALAVTCRDGSKARGVTGLSNPTGDPFWVDFVAHEFGHQWGARHTFNGTAGACSVNRNASTAYEPGSGSTIMAYAGICGAQDLQPHSDDYFHLASLGEIAQYSTVGQGGSCAAEFATGNSPPSVDAGAAFTIPLETPFTLCGTGSDPNGDPLTWAWEEFDLGPAGAPGSPSGDAPIFRSFSPATDPCRTFPRLEDLLAGSQTIGELLPDYARDLTFRLTARDNRAGGGGYAFDQVEVPVTDQAGPFLVTTPNGGESWLGLDSESVFWDPAGTSSAPVSCGAVDLLLSLDGGMTFPVTLAAGTPNDGSHSVTPPNAPTAAARLKVACSDNVFFDLSDADFTVVENGAPEVTITSPAEGALFTLGDSIPFSGSASDPEDGDLSAGLDWGSDLDGALGSGASFSAALSAGYHTVTASVADSVGQVGLRQVHVAVENPPSCPAALEITADPPAGTSVYAAVVSVTFKAGVTLPATSEVTAWAGEVISLESGVTLAGDFTAGNTPTPCS